MHFLLELNTSKISFLYVGNDCNKLDPDIPSSSIYNTMLTFVRSVEKKNLNNSDTCGIKIVKRLRLRFSHLVEHKFRHCFRETVNPLCSCSIEAETAAPCFLHYHFCNANGATLMNDLANIPIFFSVVSDNNLISLLLYDDDKFDDTKDKTTLISTIRFIKDSQRLDEKL